MKKLLILPLVLFSLSVGALAAGPVPINIWGGIAGGSFGVGGNFGIDIGATIPTLPPLVFEFESTGMILPLALVNAATASQRIGLVTRVNLIGDWLKLRLSAGAATISSNTSFIWGNEVINQTNSTAYASIGPEIFLPGAGLGAYAKAVFMNLPQATAGEVDLGLMMSF